jgi:hypothetical protein
MIKLDNILNIILITFFLVNLIQNKNKKKIFEE